MTRTVGSTTEMLGADPHVRVLRVLRYGCEGGFEGVEYVEFGGVELSWAKCMCCR